MVQHRHRNLIIRLVSKQGLEIQQHDDIEKELLSYYKNLLMEPPIYQSPMIDSILKHIPKDVMKEKNEALMSPFTQE
jgi:hypothetical protein